jgi:hypothetical protein
MQAVADVHETALNSACESSAGFGVVSIVQFAPSQPSASVVKTLRLGSSALPTAVQLVAEVHDTPSNRLSDTPDGLGVLWTDQLTPSQRSASAELPACPTAVHAVAEVQDTLRSAPARGVLTIDHLEPSQRSARGEPTAIQKTPDVHDAP